jgi:uncharacterized phage infection (PIP) family protein YhgE
MKNIKEKRYFYNNIYSSKDYFIHGFCAGLAFLFFIILIFIAK